MSWVLEVTDSYCILMALLVSYDSAAARTSGWEPVRGIFPRKKCFGNGRLVRNGLFPLATLPAYCIVIMGWGVPSLLWGGHSVPAVAAGVLQGLDHPQRKESEGKRRAPPPWLQT